MQRPPHVQDGIQKNWLFKEEEASIAVELWHGTKLLSSLTSGYSNVFSLGKSG